MLFNTLANLRSVVRDDVDRAEAMIDQLIVYLRSALAASQTESVSLSREFAQLRAYLDIMSLRMGPRLTYTLDLPPELEAIKVPPMLLQPLVENAIKHGLEPKVGPGSIEVMARAVTGAPAGIEIRINDSGLGLPVDEEDGPTARPAGASYGLQHVRDRLHAVYGPAARLSLDRRHPAGVSALVFIPIDPAQPGSAVHRCRRPFERDFHDPGHRPDCRHCRGRTRARSHPVSSAGTGVARTSHRRRRGRRPAATELGWGRLPT